LHNDTGQHRTHNTRYSCKRVGDSQQNTGVLRCYIQWVNAVKWNLFGSDLSDFSKLKKNNNNNYLNPDQANAPRPTANVKQNIDPISDLEFDAKYMNIVWLTKAPQLKTFLTYESKSKFIYCSSYIRRTYLCCSEYFIFSKPVHKEPTKLENNGHDEIW